MNCSRNVYDGNEMKNYKYFYLSVNIIKHTKNDTFSSNIVWQTSSEDINNSTVHFFAQV